MATRSANFTVVDLDPADLAHQTHALSNYFNMIKNHEANRVHKGGGCGAPTTPSTQITGAGATNWNIDVEAMVAAVGGLLVELAAAADTALHDTTQLVANGQSAVAAVFLKNVAGTITMDFVKGAAATTGSEVAPTDAAIQSQAGAGNDWVKIAECTINRTGDTTVTQSQDNTFRPVLGVNEDASFGTFTG